MTSILNCSFYYVFNVSRSLIRLIFKNPNDLGKAIFRVNVMKSPMVTCDFCGDNHANGQCLKTAQYVGNFNRQQNNLNSNIYHPRLRNHPNFSWSNNQDPPSKPMYLLGFS